MLELLNLPKSHFRLQQLSIRIDKIQSQKFWKEFKFYHLIVLRPHIKKLNQPFSSCLSPLAIHAHRIDINYSSRQLVFRLRTQIMATSLSPNLHVCDEEQKVICMKALVSCANIKCDSLKSFAPS